MIRQISYLLLALLAVQPLKAKADNSLAYRQDDHKPNILFLFADDQRNDTLGCAGHPIVETPNIDRLAETGVRFSNAFVPTSTCWVSRACLFTSNYERSHLYRMAQRTLSSDLIKTSYSAILKKAGYRTGHIGKEHVGLDPKDASAMWDVRRKLFREPYFKTQKDGSKRHTTQILGDWGIEFIREQPRDQPFLLTISFNASHAEDQDHRPGIGHFPWPRVMDGKYEDMEMPLPRLNDPAFYKATPDFLKKSINRGRYFWRWDTPEKYQTNMRAYLRMISGIDHVLGRLVEELKAQGLADNTIIVYSADNGYYMGDRGFAGKWTHYEQSLRVPLIIYDPRLPNNKRGMVRDELALNIDIGSTLVDLAGLPVPEAHQGHSLGPIIWGETPDDWRKDFLCEFLSVPPTIPRWEGVRTKDHIYARYFPKGTTQAPFEIMHDLAHDPDQLVNLAVENSDKLKELRKRTDELVASYGPAMKDVPPTIPNPRKKKKKPAAVE